MRSFCPTTLCSMRVEGLLTHILSSPPSHFCAFSLMFSSPYLCSCCATVSNAGNRRCTISQL